MGLFKFIKGQALKVIEWNDNSKDTMVYKFDKGGYEVMFGSKLVVKESQVAIFVAKGKIADVFQPGTYTLTTTNLPFLTALLKLPYGFKSTFITDVYFINTKQFTNQKWGTSNPITMRDKEFGTIRIRAFGTYAFRVENSEVFLKELFGTSSTFTTNDINNYLKSMLISYLSDTVAESKISALDLSCNLIEFTEIAKTAINKKFNELGLGLTNLVIENISFPEEVEKAIDTRSSMGVMGDQMDTYIKYQAANSMRDAAKNEGGFAGAGVGIGTGFAMGNFMQQALTSEKQNNSVEKKICPSCKISLRANAKFCPECGFKFATNATTCKACGATMKASAKFCPECGKKVLGKTCPKCRKEVSNNTKFCPNCGEKIK